MSVPNVAMGPPAGFPGPAGGGKKPKDLLDVDALKSASAFHTKPNDSDLSVLLQGVLRVVLFPCFPCWWCGQVGPWVTGAYAGLALCYAGVAFAVHGPTLPLPGLASAWVRARCQAQRGAACRAPMTARHVVCVGLCRRPTAPRRNQQRSLRCGPPPWCPSSCWLQSP